MRLRFLDDMDEQTAKEIQKAMGVDEGGIRKMAPKFRYNRILIEDLSPQAVLIIKEEMLAIGGDAVIPRSAIQCKPPSMPVIILGDSRKIASLCERLENQPFGLDTLSIELKNRMERYSNEKRWKIKGRVLNIEEPFIMGILNITPDSFFDGGKFFDEKKALKRLEEMLEEGAHIIDIGGMSTRPGSEPIPEEEELRRVLPAVREAVKLGALISVDTYRGKVADKAINAGAHIINDVSALRWDELLVKTVSDSGVGYILMHSLTTPKDMQKSPQYEDVVGEIYDFLRERLEFAVQAGIDFESTVVDFGIGFGKRLRDNLALLYNIGTFKGLGRPILVGASRKRFIKMSLGLEMEERLMPSVACAIYSIMKGADIVRVHDVKATKEAIEMIGYIEREGLEEQIENASRSMKKHSKFDKRVKYE
ncbi:MAG: dihydropteroate synthase [Candidatus Coatesbacteria bacterium 4484_99]|uniref:dihydropteroate synthase n=1 Tax=Candidatus Coatesbacteria bacterium 4484_99 TaxID=1970774 RepID=A0A1W9RZQ9_9BACT|nr:MAG: dihydropteroate synthase [Candidatus Coatesbacteria bacterium 4484_99]